jgi:hypothetical protein
VVASGCSWRDPDPHSILEPLGQLSQEESHIFNYFMLNLFYNVRK